MAPDHGRRGAGAPVRARRHDDARRPGGARRALRRGHPRHRHRRAAERRARSRPRPPRRPARWARGTWSRRAAGRARSTVDGARHEWHGAHGNRDRSWGPRRWGGPKMWRWFSINIGEDMHFGGIRLGTDAGDLHRGWVWDGDARHLGRRVAGADRAGRRRRHPPRRAPRRGRQDGPHLPAARRRAAGGRHRPGRRHHGQRGPGPLDLRGPRRRDAAPATASASTCTSSTTAGGLSSPSSRDGATARATTELAAALGHRLGGTVRRPASPLGRRVARHQRVRARAHGDGAARPLILQMDRGTAPRGRVRMEAGAAARRGDGRRAGARAWSPWARATGSGASWLVVERLEGETIPRKILRDDEWAAARRALTAQAGPRAGRHPHHRPRRHRRACPPSDPLGDPLPLLDALGEVRPALELGVRWLAAHRPAGRAAGDGARRLPVGQLPGRARTGCAASSTGSWPTPATRPRTSAGSAPRPGASAAAGEVGGFGALAELLAAYAAAGGEAA